MFKIMPNPTLNVTVNVTVPGQDQSAPLKLTCRHKPLDDLKAWSARAEEVDAGKVTNADYLGEVVQTWGDEVQDADGNPLPFNTANFAALLNNYPAARFEIYNAYLRAMSESRAKN